MKKFKKILLIVLTGSLLGASAVYAGDNPGSKLGRGLTNVVTSPLEYILQTVKLAKDHDGATAVFGGWANGTWFMIQRVCVGVYEIVTFPVPLPAKYGPVLDPDTSWTGFQKLLADTP